MERRTYHYRHGQVPKGAVMTMRRRRRTQEWRRWIPVGIVAALGLLVIINVPKCTPKEKPAPEQTATTTPTPAAEYIENFSLAYPTYLGGPQRRSTGTPPGPDGLKVIWKLAIGTGKTERLSDGKLVSWSGTGWTGQPTIVYENGAPSLLIGGYDHGLRRVDPGTGAVTWRAALDDVIKATNTVYYEPNRPAGDRLVVVTGSRRGNQYALGDPLIAPLRAFSFATGQEIWRLPVSQSDAYSQDVDASPLWVDGRLIVAVEPGYVLALDTSKLTAGPGDHPQPTVVATSPPLYTEEDVAARADKNGSNVLLEGSPAVLGDRIYIASSSGHVYGLNRTTLAIEWDFVGGGDFDSTVVVTRDGKLLVGMEREYVAHGGVFLLDPSKPAEQSVVWFYATEDKGIGEWKGGVIGSVALHPDRPLAAFTSVDGYLYVVRTDVTEGTSPSPDDATAYPRPVLAFKGNIGGSISTPAIAGERIVAAGYDKKVHLYKITWADGTPTVTEIDTFSAKGHFESTPLIWQGLVFIGCRDGNFYCLGSAPEG